MLGKRALGLVAMLAALAAATGASAKEIRVTACGDTRCRTVTNAITGIGVLPARVQAPRSGRFYTVELRGPHGWKVVYEARRGLVRAADLRARSFLGRRWAELVPGLRHPYFKAVLGLAPMSAPPPVR